VLYSCVPGNVSLSVGEFTAQLQNVTLPMGLTLANIVLRGTRLQWQKEPFSLELDEPGTFEAHLLETELARFLEKQAPAGLKNFKIQAKDGKLFIDAVKTLVFDVPAKAVCTLRIVDGKQLFVDLQSVEIMGAGAKNLVQTQLDKINPVLDADSFPVAAVLTEVTCDAGVVTVQGTVAPKG
jgi:hypothetical protein